MFVGSVIFFLDKPAQNPSAMPPMRRQRALWAVLAVGWAAGAGAAAGWAPGDAPLLRPRLHAPGLARGVEIRPEERLSRVKARLRMSSAAAGAWLLAKKAQVMTEEEIYAEKVRKFARSVDQVCGRAARAAPGPAASRPRAPSARSARGRIPAPRAVQAQAGRGTRGLAATGRAGVPRSR
jgi:hypothetical protein